jgi:putative transposase
MNLTIPLAFFWMLISLMISLLTTWLRQPVEADKRKRFSRSNPKSMTATNKPIRTARKPGWVQMEVLRLLAMTRGQVGCRTIAAMFNARFGFRGESVGKSYVAIMRKRCRYEILQLRKKFRAPPKPSKPNQTWALDWTHITICQETHDVLGVIDHGSRRLLALEFADKRAITVLNALDKLIKRFGKPRSIRTDNDGAFVSVFFALAMHRLGIRHRRSQPHSPWMNGRIERFFGTLKRALRQIQIQSKARLQQALDEFAHFYNHIRLHQNLDYRTPVMAWFGQTQFPISTTPRWFAAWDGVHCGWSWGKPADY